MVKLEETAWCLWDGAENTDYVLCKWEADLLPTLYEKDEIRFTYNQYKNTWSYTSCTIFAAIWMLSDLINYEFSYDQIKEVDDLSYTKWRLKWHGWYVKSAVKLVADWYNSLELSKTYWKVAYYRISKYADDIIDSAVDKLYTLDGNMCPTHSYNQDKADWMLDGTDFWTNTNWHSIDIIKKEGQLSVKDSSSKNQIYGLKHNLSQISNFGPNLYIYTLVKEDNLEEIKRLNAIKAECNVAIESLWKIRHLVNDTNFQSVLHYTADKIRNKINDCNNELKKYI